MIATNTTLVRGGAADRPGRRRGGSAREACRGRRSPPRPLEVLRLLTKAVGDALTLIGVGGIATPEDARERLDAGATLVQVYTGFIYGGPLWPRRIVRGLTPPSGGTP